MSRTVTATLLLLALSTPVFATESPVRDAPETAADRASRERDADELREFRELVAGLCDAYEDRMPGRYREVNDRIQKAMTREIDQARLKRAQADNEERRARNELRSERMDASAGGDLSGMSPVQDAPGSDRRSAVKRSEEMARVGTLSGALHNEIARGDRAAMARNIELAGSFLALMRADAKAAGAERADRGAPGEGGTSR